MLPCYNADVGVHGFRRVIVGGERNKVNDGRGEGGPQKPKQNLRGGEGPDFFDKC